MVRKLRQYNLEEVTRTFSKPRTNSSLLADVIGSRTTDTGVSARKNIENSKWNAWFDSVDKFIEANDIKGLEHFVLADGKLDFSVRNSSATHSLHGELSTVQTWQQFRVQDLQSVDQRKALYILAKTLDWDENDQLWIRLRSLKLLEWLNATGNLSLRSIQSVFPRKFLRLGGHSSSDSYV